MSGSLLPRPCCYLGCGRGTWIVFESGAFADVCGLSLGLLLVEAAAPLRLVGLRGMASVSAFPTAGNRQDVYVDTHMLLLFPMD